ncbi:hypothetical protein CFAM422_010125 [Trichoderma lentiforme]|uniref:Uncharacterized protein n=1 Tax=Trichoderma lentiforme TaxID=1567552 RepID=A0A9P4X9X2_9HYPO|nr:hypothetical protein CFAM422_010125 [Trichoderma lentiforme]
MSFAMVNAPQLMLMSPRLAESCRTSFERATADKGPRPAAGAPDRATAQVTGHGLEFKGIDGKEITLRRPQSTEY